MQEISIFVILKAASTDRQTRRLHIFKTFCIYLASDNTVIILVYSDQMTSEARTQKLCAWAACDGTRFSSLITAEGRFARRFLLAKRPSAAMSEKKRLPFAGYDF